LQYNTGDDTFFWGDLFGNYNHKYFEQKAYKKGIRAADQVLKKYPNHGGTKVLCTFIDVIRNVGNEGPHSE
jgi:hypothetical protein